MEAKQTKLLHGKYLSKNKTKIRIYKTLLQPIILYGSKVRPLTKPQKRKLITFDIKDKSMEPYMKERIGGYDKQYKEKAIPILAKKPL